MTQITDMQILTIALSVVIPVSMLIYSNSRVSDVKETLRAEMSAGFERVLAKVAEVGNALKIHEVEHHK